MNMTYYERIIRHFQESDNPDESMKLLIIDSIETGINYWCDDMPGYDEDKIWDMVKKGEVLTFGSEEDGEYGQLTLESIANALDRIREKYPEVYDDIVEENWDSDDCDVFFQTAVFGEPIYG